MKNLEFFDDLITSARALSYAMTLSILKTKSTYDLFLMS